MYVRWKFLNAGVCVFVVVLVVVVAPRSAGPKVSAAVPRAAIPKAACTVAGVMAMVCCFEWYGASQRPAWWASSVVARLVRCREVLRGGSSVGTRRATRRERSKQVAVVATKSNRWPPGSDSDANSAGFLATQTRNPRVRLRRGWGFASHLATSDEDRQTRPRAGGGGVGARLASSVGRAHDS